MTLKPDRPPTRLQAIWQAGWDAFDGHLPITSNPYTADTEEGNWWIAGYESCREQDD